MASAAIDPLDPSDWWPYPLPPLAALAIEAGLDYDELRDYLEREVARRQAEEEALRAVSATRATRAVERCRVGTCSTSR